MLWRTWKHQHDFTKSHSHDHNHREHGHSHHHSENKSETLNIVSPEYRDAHEISHANDIRHNFEGKKVSTSQIIIFGLTGGLIPCPASITVLLLCLQLKKIALGSLLVLCFSIGLAITMISAGVVAAISARHVRRRWSGFSKIARRAPYFSSLLIIFIGLYVSYHALLNLF